MSDRKVFHDSITPLPAQEGLTPAGLFVSAVRPEHGTETMTLLFSLAIPQEAEEQLEAKVARGEVVPLAELQKRYAANPAGLIPWLKTQGFKIVQVSKDGTSVYARATVDQIQRSLAVKMVRVTKDGMTYTAAQNAPSLPADVGKAVHAIIGLQPFRQMHRHSRKCLPLDSNRLALLAVGKKTAARKPRAGKKSARGPALGPSPNVRNAPPYLVAEVLKAYDADDLSVTGEGQTIGILIDTVPASTDLKAFWKLNNVASSGNRIEEVNVQSAHLPPPEGEETLDVEWASGIAASARVRVYATGSLQFVDLDFALDRIIADLPSEPGLRQVSISLGLGETFMGGPAGEVRTQHMKFLRLAAAGVNVFVASGDAGSNPDESGHSSTGPTQAEYESSDPSVVGVGGTTLTLAANGSVASETGWTGSGGGESIFFTRPAWQKGAGVPHGNHRLVPDVSVTADPNRGALLVLHGQVIQIGGTSWSAPIWAGFCALMNEARVKARKPPLPFLNPSIYPLMGTPCFRDIRTGSNGAFTAGPGYDMVTGIGVPSIKELIRALTQ